MTIEMSYGETCASPWIAHVPDQRFLATPGRAGAAEAERVRSLDVGSGAGTQR